MRRGRVRRLRPGVTVTGVPGSGDEPPQAHRNACVLGRARLGKGGYAMSRRRTGAHLFVIRCIVAMLLVGFTSSRASAQEEVWIDSFTVDNVPVGEQTLALPGGTSGAPDNPSDRGWMSAVWRAMGRLLGLPLRPWLGAAGHLVTRRPAVAWGRLKSRGAAGVMLAGSRLGTVELRCIRGATSGNPDADITVFIEIWLEGSGRVAAAQARGYMPSAMPSASVETVGYHRRIACDAYAGFAYAQATGTLLAD
jgi:hypothetical protein